MLGYIMRKRLASSYIAIQNEVCASGRAGLTVKQKMD